MVGTPPIFPRRDTIFALASGAGRAAIAALRLSGPACASALAALAPGARFPDRVATLRLLRDPATGEPLDRALVVRFLAPRLDLVDRGDYLLGGGVDDGTLCAHRRSNPL